MVHVKGFRVDVCVFCNRTSEGVEADFGSLKGFLCKKDFFTALKAREPKAASEAKRENAQQGAAPVLPK